MSEPSQHIDALLEEKRLFPPPPSFVEKAVISDPAIYARAAEDPEAFWAEQAERLDWNRRWDTVMEWTPPFVKWFVGGTLNASVNCLDRHVEAGGGDKVAYHWEGEPGDTRTITYRELLDEVSRLANGLRSLGVGKGDRVNIYLGMVPELPIAMLACARIGAPHSVVFGGFSADSLRDRINDAEAKVLITADGAWRRGQVVPLKANADEAVTECPSIEHVITLRRCENDHGFTEGRDIWYHDLVADQPTECLPEDMDAEDILYLLYTSGTTGKPKGIVHTTGGYLTQVAATHRMIFDIHDDDVFWCAADCGWVTGHSYIVYGPLANHTTGIMYEGAPDWPDKDRLVVDRRDLRRDDPLHGTDGHPCVHAMGDGVSGEARPLLAPTPRVGGRADQPGGVGLVLEGDRWRACSRSSTPGGKPRRVRSSSRRFPASPSSSPVRPPCPSPASRRTSSTTRATACRSAAAGTWCSRGRGPGSPGPSGEIATDTSRPTSPDTDPRSTSPGDGAKRDEDGYFWLLGRIDDVMNVAGHRLSTFEIESALVDNDKVAESAVVSKPDDLVGEAIVAFVTLKSQYEGDDAMAEELREHVAAKIGKIARPHGIIFTTDLPKTRSGKIMRRLLRDVAHGRPLGDVTTLANAEIVEQIRDMSDGAAAEDS